MKENKDEANGNEEELFKPKKNLINEVLNIEMKLN